jgi:hypothetical protein
VTGSAPRHVDLGRLFPIRRPPFAGGRWLVGVLILAAMLGAFWACGVFTETPRPTPGAPWGPALFFSVIIAYIVPIFGYISERTVAALEALSPVLDAEPGQIETWRRRVREKPVGWLVSVLLIGTVSGVIHNLVLNPSATLLLERASRSAAVAALALGILATWIVLTLVVAALLDNALLLNRVARRARVQIFDTARLRPFATVAVISTLALIGAQAAFPIMTVEGGVDPLAYVPGLLATGVPMVLLAALPVWPVHRRLAAAKRQILSDLNRRIGTLPLPDPDHPETLCALTPLLTYRREVAQTSEWPFDVGVMTRLGLYLVIPPLTWVGAALIEQLVDVFL